MDVLVDYYNLSPRQRRKGVVHVIDQIIAKIFPDYVSANERRIDIRLYGGWYEEQMPTTDAQTISTTLSRHYPAVIRKDPNHTHVAVSAELAYSLKCDPERHLWYTLRSKTAPRGIEFVDPAAAGCRHVDLCPLRPGYDFFVNGRCPERDCEITSRLVIRRREQKLVDAMLAADVFYCSRSDVRQIAVVSSDDDILPAIIMAMQCGLYVVHVHTKERHTTRRSYVHGKGHGYVQLNLREGV